MFSSSSSVSSSFCSSVSSSSSFRSSFSLKQQIMFYFSKRLQIFAKTGEPKGWVGRGPVVVSASLKGNHIVGRTRG